MQECCYGIRQLGQKRKRLGKMIRADYLSAGENRINDKYTTFYGGN